MLRSSIILPGIRALAGSAVLAICLAACPPMNPIPLRPEPRPPAPDKMTAAPLFEHGPGRAVLGEGLVRPMAALDEEEARRLIMDELYRVGIEFHRFDVSLETNADGDGEARAEEGLPSSALELDALDFENYVAFEYVSAADFLALANGNAAPDRAEDAPAPDASGRLTIIDVKGLALLTIEAHQDQADPFYLGIFYDPLFDPVAFEMTGVADPCGSPDFDGDRLKCLERYVDEEQSSARRWRERSDEVRARSREELRLQVRDFIGWLGGRGFKVGNGGV